VPAVDRFRELHERDRIFLLPNPWDVGSAKILAALGFEALATTSAGFALAIGKPDQQVTRDELVVHVAELAAATELPLNVDSERLYPDDSGGVAETVRLLADAGAAGCSIEDYDPKTGQWAIWWVDSRSPHGALDPPVKGKFVAGVGTFYADDTLRGKPIRVRFTWSKITATSARWEQAFSPDGGKTWEVNWTMQFERVS